MKSKMLIFFLLLFIVTGCGQPYEQKGNEEYINQIRKWDEARLTGLKRDNGWLNLVGLYWLKEGKNSFGSAEKNDIVFPENAPAETGTFILNDSTVRVKIDEDVNVLIDSQTVKEAILKSDIEDNTTIMDYGSLRWYLIVRTGNKYGIRLRDLNAPLAENFKGIERFPINEDWRIEAEYTPLNPPLELTIPTIIGTMEKDYAYGKLAFNINDKKYSLYPTGKDHLFIIFADETSGIETYGAGRFLTADGPDSNNIVVLDFNKAYNPPCAFTKYATCPLPPKQNRLKVRITAGEKNYGEGH